MGSEGHNNTIAWLVDYVSSFGEGYYNVSTQPFTALYSNSEGNLTVAGDLIEAEPFEYTTGGEVSAPVVAVANLGCEAADYPADVEGAVALISRGTCPFGDKSALAGAAGAVGAIIYNNADGPVGGGTLGPPPNPLGEYVPTVGISGEDGAALLEAGEVAAEIYVLAELYNVTT